MSFTKEQIEALEGLEKVFFEANVSVHDVDERHVDQYLGWVFNHLGHALRYYAMHKLASTIDFEEIARLRREEYERKLAERLDEVRDGIVLGAFHSLLSKAQKSPKVTEVRYESGDGFTTLIGFDPDEAFVMTYVRSERRIVTTLGEDKVWHDDVTYIKGSESPREQLDGLAALLDFLTDGE
jgi:hypothetical protein